MIHTDASQSGCVDGSVRLVDGVLQQEGRLEVCTYGIWGTVCQSNWNPIDAYIACNQLGYTGTSNDVIVKLYVPL